ncbi:MAG: hypothetical protein M1813_008293 [Trichoglossum hirsutum]|nr:MAG: hypothetical protein M1813_008293 [Trichoglossum hirsutum]
MPRCRSKAKGKDSEQCGPPYFVQGRLNQRSFYFVSPVGSAPFPKAPESNGDQPSQISRGMDIDVTDDGTTFERPTTNEKPKKRNASVSESPNQPPKKLRVPGGRAPVPKRVTAELDSEDEIIVSMKQAGKTCTQIAKRLRDEGRINYRDKTITSRYVRIMKAQAEQMEKDAAEKETQWQGDDLNALFDAVTAVDKQLMEEIEKLTKSKWQRVVGLLRTSRPGGIFSKAECERRFNRLVKEKELDTSNLEAQPRGPQASASHLSVSQPDTPQSSASQSDGSEADPDIPGDKLSSPREADPSNCDSYDSMLGDEESSGGDDGKYGDDERNREGSGMDDARQTARARRKSAPRAGNDTADGAAEAVTASYQGLQATSQKTRERATSSSRSDHLGMTIATSADLITESGVLADSVTPVPYNDIPDVAVTIPSVADIFAATSDSDVIASNTASCSGDAERKDYAVGKMFVRGRVVPEPAATGRRLHVQNLPCWVTPDDLQMIFYEFNFTGSICENCDEGAWFVDVATANDATRAVVTLNKQLIMNELISVVVYRHPDMLGFNFGQWPMIIDSDCNLYHIQSRTNGVASAE